MSAKFFTWTKGDRHSAAEALRSGRVVQIPVECIKGMDYARTEKGSSKASRRPPPLVLDGSPTLSSNHSSRTSNSFALQDAAVKSATSLITVMNDILCSPHLSAHLTSSHIDSAGFLTRQCRSRAYTVPSTPMFEAPNMDPVELPGSLPDDHKTYPGAHQSRGVGKYLLPQPLGEKIVRSRSSPQETTYPLPNRRGRMSVESFYRDSTFQQPSQISPRGMGDRNPLNIDALLPSYNNDETQLDQSELAAKETLKRPSLSVLPLELPKPSMPSTPLLTPQPGSMHTGAPLGLSQDENASLHVREMMRTDDDVDEAIFEQISRLREAHNAHLHSLKEAHEKEVASHKSYISFLERRQRLHAPDEKHSPDHYTAHSSHSRSESSIPENLIIPFQPAVSPTSQRSVSQGSLEATKRNFRTCCTAQANVIELRKERDESREIADRNDRRVCHLKDIVRKAKENEKAFKNSISSLEARLVAANNERTDVLEGFNEATEKLHASNQRERALIQDVEDLQGRMADFQSNVESTPRPDMPGVLSIGHKRTVSDLGKAFPKEKPLSQHLRDPQGIVLEKEAYPRQWREAKLVADPSVSDNVSSLQSGRILELEREVEKYKESLSIAEADSERYNSLLHNELRRQSRHTVEKNHAPIPQVDAEAAALATEKIAHLKTENYDAASRSPDLVGKDHSKSNSLTGFLERELEYCIKEIIMYKLDVRGYKKDLKKANAKIETLEATSALRPPTPDRESPLSVKSYTSANSHRRNRSDTVEQYMASANSSHPGLGIALPNVSRTPEKDPNVILPLSRVPATPPPRFSTMSTPPVLRPRTPLGAHKRLPKPPPPATQTPTGSPQVKTRRVDTLRSFSESMVANAKAAPLDPGTGT